MDKKKNLTLQVNLIFTVLFIVLFTMSFLHLYRADEVNLENVLLISSVNIIGLLVSLITIRYLTKQYKEDLMGFEPQEISLLYSEYKSLIDQLTESIISVDKNCNITTMNQHFKITFNLKDEHIGRNVYEVFPHIDFKEIMNSKINIQNRLADIFDEKILLSTFPLYSDNKVIGATAIMRSRLEVDMLLDQISGYRKISKALREQKHEFQNKLHVILGLIKMKDYETVNSYITENIYTTNLTTDYYSSRIKDDKVNALFVGKDIQSKEYDTVVRLTDDSYLSDKHKPVGSDDLVIVIGNLIDNALEAYTTVDVENKKVTVKILEDDNQIYIGVKDQAGGIDPLVIDRMFKRGVSTKKGNSRGTGLSLVNEIVNLYNGTKTVQSSKKGTNIEIILKKVK